MGVLSSHRLGLLQNVIFKYKTIEEYFPFKPSGIKILQLWDHKVHNIEQIMQLDATEFPDTVLYDSCILFYSLFRSGISITLF